MIWNIHKNKIITLVMVIWESAEGITSLNSIWSIGRILDISQGLEVMDNNMVGGMMKIIKLEMMMMINMNRREATKQKIVTMKSMKLEMMMSMKMMKNMKMKNMMMMNMQKNQDWLMVVVILLLNNHFLWFLQDLEI